jgi:CHC2 zinc finger
MQAFYLSPEIKSNISTVEVIGAYVPLRRSGRQFVGLCPFHAEKTPSFYVSEAGFYCFGCGARGDAIRFIQEIERSSFREALARLGIWGEYRPKPIDIRQRRAARALAGWLGDQSLKLGSLLRELSQQIRVAAEIPDRELEENLENEWLIFSDLHDDLARPELAAELFEARESIEAITAEAPAQALPEFPPLTPAYRAYIAANLPEPPC